MTIEKVYGCSKLQKFVKILKSVNSFVVVFVVTKAIEQFSARMYIFYFIRIKEKICFFSKATSD